MTVLGLRPSGRSGLSPRTGGAVQQAFDWLGNRRHDMAPDRTARPPDSTGPNGALTLSAGVTTFAEPFDFAEIGSVGTVGIATALAGSDRLKLTTGPAPKRACRR